MKKIILLIVTVLCLLTLTSCGNDLKHTYDMSRDKMNISYYQNMYDVYIYEEQRHIFIPRDHSVVIVTNETNVKVEEYEQESIIYFYIRLN